MFEIVICDESNQELVFDYWSILGGTYCSHNLHRYYKFKYKELFEKHKLKNSIQNLEKNLKNYGYILVDDCKYCPECKTEHRIYTRNELKDFLVREFNNWRDSPKYDYCEECTKNQKKDEIVLGYSVFLERISIFNEIFNNNYKCDYIYKNNEVLGFLNYLELIYLYQIYNKYLLNKWGGLKRKKFFCFLFWEDFKNNIYLNDLFYKKIIYHSLIDEEFDYFNSIDFLFHIYGKDVVNELINEIYGVLGVNNKEIHSIVYTPDVISVKSFSENIFNKLDNHKFYLDELEEIFNFFDKQREFEVVKLSSTVKFTTGFTLKTRNSTSYKVKDLCEGYNLKDIYGYLMDSVDITLFKLDYLSDRNRILLKNCFYTNCFISNKRKILEGRTYLPKNYQKSEIIIFFEEFLKLEILWEDVSVNDFKKMVYEKLKLRGLIID